MKRFVWLVLFLLPISPVQLFRTVGLARELPSAPEKICVAGLQNVFRITESLYSGNGPEGDEGFASLQQLGIKTIISVDGARPDVPRAQTFGLRSVHIPIGYNGVPRESALRIAQALRELPAPFYIHCHHGKHRGPTAAALALLSTDGKCQVEDALTVLRSAGTDPRYTGLFQSVREFQRPTVDELAALPLDLPEAVEVASLTQAMVTIDHSWEHLMLARAAGWKTPADHPDIDPAHEALQLLEGYQELRRLSEVTERPDDFQHWLDEGLASAEKLEQHLRTAKQRQSIDRQTIEQVYRRAKTVCSQCHVKHRDVPLDQ